MTRFSENSVILLNGDVFCYHLLYSVFIIGTTVLLELLYMSKKFKKKVETCTIEMVQETLESGGTHRSHKRTVTMYNVK